MDKRAHVVEIRLITIKFKNTSTSLENGASSRIGLFTLLIYATGANAITARILSLYSGRSASIANNIVVPIE